jgi:hypothetical protein
MLVAILLMSSSGYDGKYSSTPSLLVKMLTPRSLARDHEALQPRYVPAHQVCLLDTKQGSEFKLQRTQLPLCVRKTRKPNTKCV